ncbi:MAG: DUF3443 family protein, partial [Candidatus Dormibacteria bacterium]
ANVATLTVNGGPAGAINTAFFTVTLCAPGSTTNCATIGGIEVDTGSFGLRVIASALPTGFAQSLPTQVAGSVPVVECAQFADGYSWGPVKNADVTISSETAANIPIHVMGDPAFPSATIPADCKSPVPNEEDTVSTFGANGILGVGPFIEDCGSGCAAPPQPGVFYPYFVCPPNGAACTHTTEALNLQVVNPVAFFASDNNGVIVELPSTATGATSATGMLVFGIGTEGNNSLGSATVLTTDPVTGVITVNFNGTSYPMSFLDSGSNGNFFTDSALSVCASGTAGAGFYCSDASNLSAMLVGANGMQLTATFSINNATTLFSTYPSGTVFPTLGGPVPGAPQTFDFGLPFFYGRNVFTAIEGRNTPGGMGPYIAY